MRVATVIEVSSRYAAEADAVWRAASHWGNLQPVTGRMMRYYGLPTEPMAAGQDVHCETSLFGVARRMPWAVRILECDAARRLYHTIEHGGPVNRWEHVAHVWRDEAGTVMRDVVTIEAGRQTALVARWARLLYAARHAARQRIIALSETREPVNAVA